MYDSIMDDLDTRHIFIDDWNRFIDVAVWREPWNKSIWERFCIQSNDELVLILPPGTDEHTAINAAHVLFTENVEATWEYIDQIDEAQMKEEIRRDME